MKKYFFILILFALLDNAIFASSDIELDNDEHYTKLLSIEKEAIKELKSECEDLYFGTQDYDVNVEDSPLVIHLIDIKAITISSRMLENLYKLKNLKSLDLAFSEIDQDAILNMKRLPNLETLSITYWNKDELVRSLEYDKSSRSSLQRLLEGDDSNDIEDDNINILDIPMPEYDKSKIPDKHKSLDWIINISSAKVLHCINIACLSKQGLEKLVPNKSVHDLTLCDPSLEELQIIKKMAVTKLDVFLGCSYENLAEFKEFQKKFGDILSVISQLQVLIIGGTYYDLKTDCFYSLVDDQMIVKLGKLHLKALQISEADISLESVQLLSKLESLYEVGLPNDLIKKYGSLKGKVVFYSYLPCRNIEIDDDGNYIPWYKKILQYTNGKNMSDDEIKDMLKHEEERLRNSYKHN